MSNVKEIEENTELISLEEYYSYFFYKDHKFKSSLKSKFLRIREYFCEHPKQYFLCELLLGIITFGFPISFFYYYLRSFKYSDNVTQMNKEFLIAVLPMLSMIAFYLIMVFIFVTIKIKRLFQGRMYIIYILSTTFIKYINFYLKQFLYEMNKLIINSEFPSWERFHLGKLTNVFINLIFLMYFIINFIAQLNIISPLGDVFRINVNNINTVKSLISRILYYNIFQKFHIMTESPKNIQEVIPDDNPSKIV